MPDLKSCGCGWDFFWLESCLIVFAILEVACLVSPIIPVAVGSKCCEACVCWFLLHFWAGSRLAPFEQAHLWSSLQLVARMFNVNVGGLQPAWWPSSIPKLMCSRLKSKSWGNCPAKNYKLFLMHDAASWRLNLCTLRGSASTVCKPQCSERAARGAADVATDCSPMQDM